MAVSLEASRRPLSSDISIGRVRCREGRFPGVRVSQNAVTNLGKSRKIHNSMRTRPIRDIESAYCEHRRGGHLKCVLVSGFVTNWAVFQGFLVFLFW